MIVVKFLSKDGWVLEVFMFCYWIHQLCFEKAYCGFWFNIKICFSFKQWFTNFERANFVKIIDSVILACSAPNSVLISLRYRNKSIFQIVSKVYRVCICLQKCLVNQIILVRNWYTTLKNWTIIFSFQLDVLPNVFGICLVLNEIIRQITK